MQGQLNLWPRYIGNINRDAHAGNQLQPDRPVITELKKFDHYRFTQAARQFFRPESIVSTKRLVLPEGCDCGA